MKTDHVGRRVTKDTKRLLSPVVAAVIPSLAEKAGEVPIAFVVLKKSVTPTEIIDFVAERVAAHKKIRRVEFVDEIPKSPAGKILRRLLMQRVREQVRRS